MQTVSIIGFGRFGQTLYRLLQDDFNILLYDQKNIDTENVKIDAKTKVVQRLEAVYNAETKETHPIFYCVPISEFERVIREHKKYFKENHLLLDVLSVKVHAQNVFEKHLDGTDVQALLTHPMFGPDSSKQGFANLPIILDKFLSNQKNYDFWKNYFQKKGLRVVEMSAKEHDKLAANSQGVTHFLGRTLSEFGLKPTKIDSMGAKKLQEVVEQTCNDTWQLFLDLQNYNPYTKKMRLKVGCAYDRIYNQLLPGQVNPNYLTFGIQGGAGSFNEQALLHYVKKHKIKNYKTKYLFTTERVLSELHKGNIDYGQFAMHNSIGGIVQESVQAIARYKFKIVEEFAIKISHFMMKRKDISEKEVKTVISHPQGLKQCQDTLKQKRFSHLKFISGKGDLIDHAIAAKALAQGKLLEAQAVIGPKILSDLYNLEIIAENLQDDKENYTSFLMVKRF